MRASAMAASWLINSVDASGRVGLLASSNFGTGPNSAITTHEAIATMETMANQRNARDRSRAWATSSFDVFFVFFTLCIFSCIPRQLLWATQVSMQNFAIALAFGLRLSVLSGETCNEVL